MNGIELNAVNFNPPKPSFSKAGRENLFVNLNLQLNAHEITCLVGPNGSGKSSLLKLLAGILKPQSGRITLEEIPLERYARKALARKLAYLPQHCLLPASLTVREYVALARFCHQSWFAELTRSDQEAIAQAIALTDLSSLADKCVSSLSAGQQQRARIAFMLAQQVNYLLLDEPMTGLDLKQQRNILTLLKYLKDEAKKTIILVLHDLQQVREIADTVIMLKAGAVFACGKAQEVISEMSICRVFDM